MMAPVSATCIDVTPGRLWSRPISPRGFSLEVVRGRAWITMDGKTDDVVLSAGQTVRGDGPGLVVVQALEPAQVAWADAMPPSPPSWLGLPRRTSIILALAVVYLVWGSTYYALAIGVRSVPPFMFAGVRFAIAGLAVAAWAVFRGERWPGWAPVARGGVVGFLLFVIGNGGVTWAEQEVSSGLTAVVVASMPIWLAMFAATLGERPSRREALGLVVGLGGVVALHAGSSLGGSSTAAIVLFVSPVGWALGSLLARRWTLPTGAAGLASEMLPAAVVLLLMGAVAGERVPDQIPGEVVASMLYLIVFGSLLGVSAYTFLLRATRPAVATSYAYVNPIAAVLLGVVVGGETIGPSALLAGALILAGVALATWRR